MQPLRRDGTTAWALEELRSHPELAVWATGQRQQKRRLAAGLTAALCLAAALGGGWAHTAYLVAPQVVGDVCAAASPARAAAETGKVPLHGRAAAAAALKGHDSPALVADLRASLAQASAERHGAVEAAAAARNAAATAAAALGRQEQAWQAEMVALQRRLQHSPTPSAAGGGDGPRVACGCKQGDVPPPCTLVAAAAQMRSGQWTKLGGAAWAVLALITVGLIRTCRGREGSVVAQAPLQAATAFGNTSAAH